MNLYRCSQILISSAVVILTGLVVPAKPLLAHSGHHRDSTKQEQVVETKEPSDHHTEMHREIGDSPESQPSPKSEVSPVLKLETAIPTASESTQMSLLPQPGELVFLLLVTGPFGLFSLKRWMHKR